MFAIYTNRFRLYLIHFVDMLQNYIDSGLNPYITSAFGSHGLLTVGTVVSTALGGCAPLTLAKVIDIWGRVEGFCFMLLVCVAGMIVKAVCKNVQSYIGGHILYWTGHIGLLYVIDVMCADITSLKNRMIIFGINQTPRIAATFAGPALVDKFLYGPGWRWAFGAFIIILVACSIPAMGVMLYMYRKARQAGYAQKERSGRSAFESVKHYTIEFDSKCSTKGCSTLTNIVQSLVSSCLWPPGVSLCCLSLYKPTLPTVGRHHTSLP